MSLINDAIKKANQANKEKSTQPTGSGGANATNGMQATGHRAPPPSGSLTGMFIITGIVIFVLLGGFLLMLGMKNRTPARTRSGEDVQAVVVPDAIPATGPRTSPPPEAEPVVVHASIGEAVREANPHLADPAATTAVVLEATPPPKPAGPPEFPAVKLQGIFYRLNDPSVIINGKTLRTGEIVDGVKVTAIERSTVKVEFNDETKVLELK
jgi:hypothetical protein